MSNFSLHNKTVIVTGGAGGLGRAMCANFVLPAPTLLLQAVAKTKLRQKPPICKERL